MKIIVHKEITFVVTIKYAEKLYFHSIGDVSPFLKCIFDELVGVEKYQRSAEQRHWDDIWIVGLT